MAPGRQRLYSRTREYIYIFWGGGKHNRTRLVQPSRGRNAIFASTRNNQSRNNAVNKVVLIINIKSMNVLPVMERWLSQIHAPEAISRIGPWLTRYHSYRAVPPPPEMYADAEDYGYYNWRVTELWCREPFPQAGILPQAFFPEYADNIGLPTNLADASRWHGKRSGPRQACRLFVPARATEDFLGGEVPLNDYPSILRWFVAFRYPDGVSIEEGEEWYLSVHAPETLRQQGLRRFTSHKANLTPDGKRPLWHRLSELWYDDFSAWRNAVIEAPPSYTPPPWDGCNRYPFFEPFVDFVGTFLLEAPTNNFLRDYQGYIVSV